MARISALIDLAEQPAVDDIVPIVDVSDVTQSAAGSTKRNTYAHLVGNRFSPTIGHRHDGTDARRVPVVSLDPAGVTASHLVRVNATGTALESSGRVAPAGDIVGTTDVQTLENKTLTKPTINASVGAFTTHTPAAAGTATLDLSNSNVHSVTMPAGNITLALASASIGQIFILRIRQDAVGSRLVTWFAGIAWQGGTAPILTTTANRTDTFGFICIAAGTFAGYIIGQNEG